MILIVVEVVPLGTAIKITKLIVAKWYHWVPQLNEWN